MRIPLARDPRAMFGSAIHHAIKIYHQHRRRGLPVTVLDVLGAFEGAWSSEGFYTREHEERRLEEGRTMLRRFFEREERSGIVPLAVEAEFAFTQGHDTVTGRFDRIDERDGAIVIVDYKTAEVEAVERAEFGRSGPSPPLTARCRRKSSSSSWRPASSVRPRSSRSTWSWPASG